MNKCIAFALFILLLDACTSPEIQKGYNEVTNQKFCRLVNFPLASSFKRKALLHIEKDQNDMKTSLQVEDISTLSPKCDFRDNPKIMFATHGGDKTIDSIQVNTHTEVIKDWDEPVYHGGRSIGQTHHSRIGSIVFLSPENLKKLAYANSVSLVISDHKDLMENILDASDLEILKQFDRECLGAQ